MSFILDALRRADAERERGGVPGIHAQHVPGDGDEFDAEPPRRGRPGRWFAGGAGFLALLLLLGALGWYLLRYEEADAAGVPLAVGPKQTASGEVAPAVGALVPATATAPAPVPAPASVPGPASVAALPLVPAPSPAPAAARTPAPAPASPPATPAPAPAGMAAVPETPQAAAGLAPRPRTEPRALPPPRPPEPGLGSRPRPTQRAATAPAATGLPAPADAPPVPPAPATREPAAPARQAAAPAAVEPRIYAQNELPAEIRRQLPKLSIGGSIYSEDRANRFIIINGQVFHEGSQPAPGLVLEQIRLKSAVLSFKDYRYSISY